MSATDGSERRFRFTGIVPRYRPLALYSLLLAAAAATWLAWELARAPGFPAGWVVLLCIGFNLFVFHFGILSPWVGLTSLERLPQIGLLLVLPPVAAAAICAAASLVWPLVNRAYSHGSSTFATLRAMHNAAMTALMLMLAGHAYLAAGGRHPLDSLQFADLLPLAVMALTAQAVNVALMALFYRFDRRDVRGLIRPIYSIMDLVFVPAGVLAALLYNADRPAVFALFMALMVVFVLSFNGVGRALMAENAQRNPIGRLFKAGRELHGARRVDELGVRILEEIRPLFRFEAFQLALVSREEPSFDIRVHERRGERLPRRCEAFDAGPFGGVVENGPLLVDDPRSMIAVPLLHYGEVIGLISVEHTETAVYSDADLHLLQRLAERVEAAVADARAFEDLQEYRAHLEDRVAERTAELEKASSEKERLIVALREHSRKLERETLEDPLTGIANRRCFMKRLAAEFEVARAVGAPLSLAIADLDGFKRVNDDLGHLLGDEALRRSATLLRQHCRELDLVARIGGEEFALILPGMTHEEAAGFCDRLRSAVETHEWHTAHPRLSVTISIGISQWNGAAGIGALMDAADAQLYRAKCAGRNRVASHAA